MSGISGLFSPVAALEGGEAVERVNRALRTFEPGVTLQAPKDGWGNEHVVMASVASIPSSDDAVSLLSPRVSADGSIFLAWEGDIYNHALLRSKLEEEGVRLRGDDVSEIALEGYRLWGLEGLLTRLNGAFAFALFDKRSGQIYLVRDRAGNKPLFFSLQGGLLSFSSQLRAFKHLMFARWRLDASALATYLQLRFVPSPHTLIQGISRLPAGHYVAMGANGIPFLRRYWHPWMQPTDRVVSAKDVETALEESVRRRWLSRGRACLFSNNEWETALLASCVQRMGATDATVYFLSNDASPEARTPLRQALRKFGCHLENVTVDERRVLDILHRNAARLDEPLSDGRWVSLVQAGQMAQRDGFQAALVNTGVNETFFGAISMRKALLHLESARKPSRRLLAKAASFALGPVARVTQRGHRRFERWRRMAQRDPVYLGSASGFELSQLPQVLGPAAASLASSHGTEFVRALYQDYDSWSQNPGDDVNRLCYLEFATNVSEILLPGVDRAGRGSGFETRTPFVDHDVVELAFHLEGNHKFSRGQQKAVLRQLASHALSPEALRQKETETMFPAKTWFKGEFGDFVEETFQSSALFKDGWIQQRFALRLLSQQRQRQRDHVSKLWQLLDLALWYDAAMVG